jgi:polar amino acid transport system ATP-binding protein
LSDPQFPDHRHDHVHRPGSLARPGSGYPEGAAMPDHVGEVIVRAQGIEKYFGDLHVLRGVDLEVRQREAVMVLGRSGSGKTTLLRCINFLEEPTAGSVEIDGLRVEADPLRGRNRRHREEIRQLRLRTGMLFQEFNLFPHMSVIDNCIEAPTRVLGVRKAEAIETAEGYLAKVGLSDKRNEYPSRLSGGQKQRAAIARALCMEPRVLLFDEPTSALDPELIGEVLKVMEELAHEGTTMIVVTHEMHFAREAADRIVYMDDGLIIEQGPPEQVLDDPQDENTRQFLRRFLAPEKLTADDLRAEAKRPSQPGTERRVPTGNRHARDRGFPPS